MNFIERIQADGSKIVEHRSRGVYIGVIDATHRLWTNYQRGENVSIVPYVAPQAPVPQTTAEKLVISDAGMIRVYEDLISVLIAKGVIVLSDLPQAAQGKYTYRQGVRNG